MQSIEEQPTPSSRNATPGVEKLAMKMDRRCLLMLVIILLSQETDLTALIGLV